MEKIKLGPQVLLYPAVALIGSNVNKKPNFMTVSWCTMGALKPPSVAFPMNRLRYTLKGIKENGTFSVNIVSCDMAKKTDYCGIYSGKNKDKSQIFNPFYGVLGTAPLIQECPLNMECKTIHYLDLGSHFLIVGEVIETYLTERCITDGKPDPIKIDPLIYITRTMKYYHLGELVASAFNIGKESDDLRPAEAVLGDCLKGK